MNTGLLNKKYTLEMEVLTPLHIGAGSEKDWMKGADFIQDGNKIYILNHKKLLKKMSAEELSGYLVKKDDSGLKNKISGSLGDVADVSFSMPAPTDNDIKVFIKNGLTNKPIVPGSSLKGAIRSILLEYFLNGQKPNRLNERQIFGSSTDGDEFMRFIKISDADFEKTELVNTKIFNLYKDGNEFKGGWKHSGGKYGKTTSKFKPSGFNTVYEVIKHEETGILSIALSEKAFDNYYKNHKPEQKNAIIHSEPSKKLFAIINNHTKKYIDKQIDFFTKYSNNETDRIIALLRKIKKEIPNDNSSCILRMSAGSGFHSITGDWQFDDFSINQIDTSKRNRGKLKGKPSAKSRKIAIDGDNFYLMGFVKLTVLDEETIAQREKEKQEKIEAERLAEQERIAKEKAERERIEAEKQAKLEAERKAEEERLRKELEEKEKLEALIKQKEEEEKRRQEANREKLSMGLAALNDEKSYNSGKNLIIKYKKKENGINESDFEYIHSFVTRYFNAADKEWKNFKRGKRWKEISGWVGKEIAQQWFNELTK